MKRILFLTAAIILIAGMVQLAVADERAITGKQEMMITQQSGNNNTLNLEVRDPEVQKRLQSLGLVIPEHVKKRFEELDKLPPPPLIDSRDRFDWRDMGGVTPVKDQANCGSCWDFAATGAFESAILILDGIEMDLSEQQVLSCNPWGSSCSGGWMEDAYALFRDHGAVEELCMPYEADDDVPCTEGLCDVVATLYTWIDIPNNVNSIKNALLDGPISTTFMVYGDFHWDCYWHADTGDLNHAVVIVGWDDSICNGGGWILKNSWGSSWGDNGYFYMPYGSCGIGRFSMQPILPGLTFNYPNGLPDLIQSTGGSTVRVEVEGLAGTPEPGTGLLHYDSGSGWGSVAMDVVSPNVYDAVFPAFECGIDVDYYFGAETDEGEVFSDPQAAPWLRYSVYSFINWYTLFEDDFETNQDWTVENACTDGQWERGVPVSGDYKGNPSSDYDGSGSCYLTDNVDGNSDVDDGYTYLISPAFDLTGSDALIQYALWYTNNFDDDPNNDLFKVWVSNDNGSNWTHVETFGPSTTAGWTEQAFLVSDNIAPSSQVKVRFEASDLNSESVVEAAIDDFKVVVVEGEGGPAVSVTITPDDPPVEVLPGGSFSFTGSLTNNQGFSTTTDSWIMVDVPGFGMYGPVFQVDDMPLSAGQTRMRTGIFQNIPGGAPSGLYNYIAYCGEFPSSPIDSSSFEFTVTGAASDGSNNWILEEWLDDGGWE
jgi:hypothetical protein